MRHLKAALAVVVFLSLSGARPAHAEFYISEFMASNHLTLADEDGDYPDWLEIYNASSSLADLSGYYLSDDAAQPSKWQFPSTPVPPFGYVLVFASGKNRAVAGAQLHTNFKLSASGEALLLVEPDGVTPAHAYTPAFPPQESDVSYGLASDLLTQRCFFDPTPAAVNDESRPCAEVEAPVFDVDRGFYDAPFDVTISTPTAGAQIYYTLDGSEPSETGGTLYAGPIQIAGTTILRAAAYLPPLRKSDTITQSYIFLSDVLTQTGAGFPPAFDDYAMDPFVTADPNYHDRLLQGLRDIPTLSIVADVDDLFGPENGIYTHGGNHGVAWERPASAELIRADGGDEMQVNCGIRIQGGAGRALSKKKSLRLAFKSIYGPAELDFPFFEDSPVDHFDKIRLRAGHNKSWASGSSRATYVRDQWMHDTLNDMGRANPHGTFVHLYLNGLYWGLYNAVEKPDESFASSHFGGDKDAWDILKAGAPKNGTKDAWNAAQDIAKAGVEDQAGYDALAQLVDMGNFTDYIIANFYAGTWDWDKHNWFAGRLNVPGNTFKFFSWDAEYSLDTINANRIGMHTYAKPTALYAALRKNAEYRQYFGDRIHRAMFNDGPLTADNSLRRYMKRAQAIDRAVIGESARWGDASRRQPPYTRDRDWLAELQYHRQVFFYRRAAIFLDQLVRTGLYPSIEAVSFSQQGGDFAPGSQLAMSAPAGTIHYTIDGSDPRAIGGSIAPSAQTYSAPIPLAGSVTIAARAFDGAEWSALNQARFVAETPLRVTELMYNPPQGSDLEYVELQNIGTATFDLAGVAFTDGILFSFPAYVLAAGERVLIVRNQAAFEAAYGTTLPVAGQYSGRLNNVGDRLRLSDAGGDTIQDFYYDDVWYPSTDGGGYALVVRDALAAKEVWETAGGWRAGTYLGGSPGAVETALCSDGLDNDGDGNADYPADAGCASADGDSEDPECDDGIDNDGDGLVDSADAQCTTPTVERELVEPIDTFSCYGIKSTKGGPEFAQTVINLNDPFDGPRDFTVKRPKQLCLPAAIRGGAVADPTIALLAYPIVADRSDPDHEPQTDYLIESLGPMLLETTRPSSLLVPTAIDETAAVAAPADASHAVDWYKCYRVKVPRDSPRYVPNGIQLRATDRFEDREYRLKKPREMCVAVSADGRTVKDPGGHLACYRSARARSAPKHTRRLGVHANNGIAPGQFDTRDGRQWCVPARRP